MSIQQKMKACLEKVGLPYKEIEVYGRQIVITAHCLDTAEKWAGIISKFAKFRGIVATLDYAKENKGTVLRPTMVKVWRAYGCIE